MKKIRMIKVWIQRVICFLEESPISVQTCFISIFTVVSIRYFFENLFFDFKTLDFDFFIASFFDALLLFFIFSFVLHVIFLKIITKEKIKKIANIVIWGQWIVLLPPIVDKIIFQDRYDKVWSFYIFDSVGGIVQRFFTFFGDNPSFGITWGSRTGVLIAVIFLGIYIYIKKGKLRWLFFGFILAYVMLFSLTIIPNIITYFVEIFSGNNLFAVTKKDIIKLFLTPLRYFDVEKESMRTVLAFKMALFYNILLFLELVFLQFIVNKNKFFVLVKNIRFPQMVFNTGLVCMGLALGAYYFPQNFSVTFFSVLVMINLWIAVFSAWYFSVFVNDIADIEIDKISNKARPLIRGVNSVSEFRSYAFIFLFMTLVSGIVLGVKILLVLILYLLITWVYSQHPFHLKRFIFIASTLSSFASLLFLLIGYLLVSDGQTMSMFPWRIVVFLFVVYAFSIPVKDLKDVEGDRKNNVITLPVLVGLDNARLILGVCLFLSYAMSVIVLNEKALLIPALLFGLISYYVVTNQKYPVRSLPWWVLWLMIVYGLLSVWITLG